MFIVLGMYNKMPIYQPYFTGQHEDLPTDVLVNIKEASFQVAMRGFFILLAISLHAIFEGIAIGLGAKASFVWYLCFAIAAHKFIIAFCIGLQVNVTIICPYDMFISIEF